METQTAPSLKPEKESVQPLTEEAQEKMELVQEFGQQVVKDVKEGTLPIPEEKKQEIKFRFKSILRKLSSDPNYRSAVDGIISLFDQVNFYTTQIKDQAKEEAKPFFYAKDTAISKFFCDLKLFLSGFTGQDALENFNNHSYEFLQLVMNDERLVNFFWEFRGFIIDALSNPNLLDDENFSAKWDNFYDRAQVLLNDPLYNNQWSLIWFDLRLCLENIKHDTLLQKLSSDATTLAKDLFLDTTGNPSLTVLTTGLDNMRKFLLPVLKKNLENLWIPAFSGTNETYDWCIDGLYLNAKEILPDNIDMKVWGKANVSLTETPSQAITYMTMWIRNMHLEAKDLRFHFTRKAIPKMDERGICDVNIKGTNELKITWKIEGEQDKAWEFSVEQAICSLNHVDIFIKESTHTWLMKMITTLFAGSIRKAVEEEVEKNVKEGLATINDKMNDAVKGITF